MPALDAIACRPALDRPGPTGDVELVIDTVPRPDATLPQLLAARARHASDARLVLDAVGGLVVLAAALLWRGPAWHLLASIAACFVAFGGWGIADRELGELDAGSRRLRLVLQGARIAAALLGTLAVFVVLASALGLALGRMIS